MSRLFRIAPTPSGYLHIGNAFNFLLVEYLAKKHNAGILLRIDDLDKERVRDEYLVDVFETLHWLGIQWHEGPQNFNELETWSQHSRLQYYFSFLEKLEENNLLFPCTCSRKVLGDLSYPGTCLNKKETAIEPYQMRVKTPMNMHLEISDGFAGMMVVDWSALQYFVVQGKNGLPAYQLASVADDVLFGVTDIVRGMDLLPSTAAQLWLSGQLELTQFGEIQFYHHHLLQNEFGQKISKSAGDLSLKSMRKRGKGSDGIRLEFEDWLKNSGVENL